MRQPHEVDALAHPAMQERFHPPGQSFGRSWLRQCPELVEPGRAQVLPESLGARPAADLIYEPVRKRQVGEVFHVHPPSGVAVGDHQLPLVEPEYASVFLNAWSYVTKDIRVIMSGHYRVLRDGCGNGHPAPATILS